MLTTPFIELRKVVVYEAGRGHALCSKTVRLLHC